MIKAVFDTNVFISALLWEGLPNKLLTLVRDGKIKLYLTLEILSELEEVLKRNKFQTRILQIKTDVNNLIEGVVNLSEIYNIQKKVTIIKDDPDDNIFLACAYYAEADFIVSGDKHLLELRIFHNIKIYSPKQFWLEIKKNLL